MKCSDICNQNGCNIIYSRTEYFDSIIMQTARQSIDKSDLELDLVTMEMYLYYFSEDAI